MASTLETKLRTAALLYPPLTALLGTSPFRWYDAQLREGSLFPAVTVLTISGAATYAFTGRLPTWWSRVQFTIWDTDPERGRSVEVALMNFVDQLNVIGIPGLAQYPCGVVLRRTGFFPEPSPPQYLRYIDTNIFSNELL
jgi:hypothetical protein